METETKRNAAAVLASVYELPKFFEKGSVEITEYSNRPNAGIRSVLFTRKLSPSFNRRSNVSIDRTRRCFTSHSTQAYLMNMYVWITINSCFNCCLNVFRGFV